MMADLADVVTGDLITAARSNDINDYIHDATHLVNTLSLKIGGTEVIDSSKNINCVGVTASGNVTGANLNISDWNAAFTHVSASGSSHSDVATNTTHRGLTNNPHSVTATQVGLGNVSDVATDDTAYNSVTWDANLDAATKNVIRDKFVSVDSAVSSNTTHRSSDGSDHSYIDQDVTFRSSPEFDIITSGDGGTESIKISGGLGKLEALASTLLLKSSAGLGIILQSGDNIVTTMASGKSFEGNLNGEQDLGRSVARWRNLFLSGNLSDGTNALTVANAKAAYDHVSLTNNPHSVTFSQVGAIEDTNDAVKDTHIDWGTSTNQVSAVDVPIADVADDFTGTEIETALTEISLLDGTRPFTGTVGGIDPVVSTDLATKEYVDTAINFIDDFFLNNTASDIGGIYYEANESPTGEAESSLSQGSITQTNAQPLYNFATLVSFPGVNTLVAGIYALHIHAEKTGGGARDVEIYFEIYTRTSGGTETLRATSETSGLITSKADFDIHASVASNVDINTTDRIVWKLFANGVSGGNNATIVLYLEGTNNSHVTVPTTTEVLNSVFVRQDGTTPLTANWDTGNFDITTQNITFDGTLSDGTASLTGGALTGLTTLNAGTGLVKTTSGTISLITDSSTNWDAAFAHVSSSGTSHSGVNGVVTIHSDVSDAGSGIIISAAERTAIGTNTSDISTNVTAIGLNTTHRGSDGSDHSLVTAMPAANILAGTFGTGAYTFDNTISGITTLTATTITDGTATLSSGNLVLADDGEVGTSTVKWVFDDTGDISTTSKVGIKIATPEALWHVQNASSGRATAQNFRIAQGVLIENNVDAVLGIESPVGNTQEIWFMNSDTVGSGGGAGRIRYESTGDALELWAANNPKVWLYNTEVVVNEDGGNIDFRVEGTGKANALFVQGSDGFVGVNTASPQRIFSVKGASGIETQLMSNSVANDSTASYGFRHSTADSSVNTALIRATRTNDPNAGDGTIELMPAKAHTPTTVLTLTGTDSSAAFAGALGVTDVLTAEANNIFGTDHQYNVSQGNNIEYFIDTARFSGGNPSTEPIVKFSTVGAEVSFAAVQLNGRVYIQSWTDKPGGYLEYWINIEDSGIVQWGYTKYRAADSFTYELELRQYDTDLYELQVVGSNGNRAMMTHEAKWMNTGVNATVDFSVFMGTAETTGSLVTPNWKNTSTFDGSGNMTLPGDLVVGGGNIGPTGDTDLLGLAVNSFTVNGATEIIGATTITNADFSVINNNNPARAVITTTNGDNAYLLIHEQDTDNVRWIMGIREGENESLDWWNASTTIGTGTLRMELTDTGNLRLPTGGISTSGNEVVKFDVIRHSVSVGEATANVFTVAWNKGAVATIVEFNTVVLSSGTVYTAYDDTSGSFLHNITYQGTAITVTDSDDNWVAGDIVTIYVTYT